jgi:hypothetical protein
MTAAGLMLSPVAGLILLMILLLVFSPICRRRPGLVALLVAVPVSLAACLGILYLSTGRPAPAQGPAATVWMPDDHQSWQKMEVLGARVPSKSWVVDGGGSSYQQQAHSGWSINLRVPSPKGDLPGYSALEATPEEALKGARRSLAAELKALVRAKLARSGVADPWGEQWEGILEESAGRLVAQPQAEVDRYEESVELPMSRSQAHRAAVLVRVPGDWSARAAGEVIEAARVSELSREEHRRSLGWTVLSALLLGLVIYFIYSFLNAGSKGHLAWPLRLVSLAAYLLLCLGLLFLRGRFP